MSHRPFRNGTVSRTWPSGAGIRRAHGRKRRRAVGLSPRERGLQRQRWIPALPGPRHSAHLPVIRTRKPRCREVEQHRRLAQRGRVRAGLHTSRCPASELVLLLGFELR